MDNQRVFLWAALALVLWLNYMAWERDYAPAAPAPQATSQVEAQQGTGNDTLPAMPSSEGAPPALPTSDTAPAAQSPSAQAPTIRVTTDVLSMDISTRGGELVRADLLQYPRVKNQPDVPVRLFNTSKPGVFVARSGLRAVNEDAEPTHLATFESATQEYRLEEGAEKLVVPLTWSDGQGVTVTKTYTFYPGPGRHKFPP